SDTSDLFLMKSPSGRLKTRPTLRERLAQQCEAARHRRAGVLAALELQRNVAAIAMLAEHRRDAVVVEVEGVPNAPAIVGLGLSQHRPRRQLLHLLVHVVQEVAGVQRYLEPWRLESVDHAQHTVRCSAQAPVVFQAEEHTAALRRPQATAEAVDHPAEAL